MDSKQKRRFKRAVSKRIVSIIEKGRARKVAVVEQHDNFAGLRNGLHGLALARNEYAGIPLPLEDEGELVIEPSYPYAQALVESGQAVTANSVKEKNGIRNMFWSSKLRCTVVMFDLDGGSGKVGGSVTSRFGTLSMELHTMGCAVAWGVEQESQALHTLGTMLRHHQFKNYLLTGTFLERSKRSDVMYMFRKLRPTVAIRADDKTNTTRVLCTLCMHPIAYYEGTWAGAMCPTDDVIAHLTLMRGDEPMFWRRANQHAAHKPQSGL